MFVLNESQKMSANVFDQGVIVTGLEVQKIHFDLIEYGEFCCGLRCRWFGRMAAP